MLIIKIRLFAKQMDALNLYSEDEHEERKYFNEHIDSLSPTPSPTPCNSHLILLQNNTAASESEILSPLSPAIKGRRGRRSQDQMRVVNRGHWSLEQNKRYHWFLEIHYSHFVNRHMRRMDKIFKSMEMFVGTRQAEQCRSHHQKMEKKYLNFTTIITNLRKQHYNSIDVDPVLEEINTFGAHATEGLATIQYLMEQQAIEPASELKQRRKSLYFRADREDYRQALQARQIKQTKETRFKPVPQEVEIPQINSVRQQQGRIEDEHQQQEGLFVGVDMLRECEMNIGELSVYHREENSSIFNSIFL